MIAGSSPILSSLTDIRLKYLWLKLAERKRALVWYIEITRIYEQLRFSTRIIVLIVT